MVRDDTDFLPAKASIKALSSTALGGIEQQKGPLVVARLTFDLQHQCFADPLVAARTVDQKLMDFGSMRCIWFWRQV